MDWVKENRDWLCSFAETSEFGDIMSNLHQYAATDPGLATRLAQCAAIHERNLQSGAFTLYEVCREREATRIRYLIVEHDLAKYNADWKDGARDYSPGGFVEWSKFHSAQIELAEKLGIHL
jgi:hypothetical protein